MSEQAIAGFLGTLLAWSAISKALDGHEVQRTLQYALSIIFDDADIGGSREDSVIAAWAARVLIVVETATGGSLIFLETRRRFLGAGVLFAGFSLFVLFLLISDAPVSCGCGIGSSAQVDGWALARSGSFFGLAIMGWWLAGRDGSVLRASGHTLAQKGNEP